MGATFRRRIVGFAALSLAVHLSVTAFLAFLRGYEAVRTAPPKEQAVKIYPAAVLIAGGAKAPWTPKPPGRKKHPVEVKQPTTDLAIDRNPAPAAGAPVAAPHSDAAGNGADQQNANAAFPDFSPWPAVADRSLLPDSSRQVIVDVTVSASGDVLEAKLVQGIGNGLDALVLSTVKTWHFHPATLNGSPVATESELIFPFSKNYPMAG